MHRNATFPEGVSVPPPLPMPAGTHVSDLASSAKYPEVKTAAEVSRTSKQNTLTCHV